MIDAILASIFEDQFARAILAAFCGLNFDHLMETMPHLFLRDRSIDARGRM
jgi:hypothetical protein